MLTYVSVQIVSNLWDPVQIIASHIRSSQAKIDFIANLLYSIGETHWENWRSALEKPESPVLRLVVWLGNSKANLLDFPKEVQKLMGDELQLMQYGGMPQNAEPYRGIGSGVFEIALSYETNAYRTVVALQIGKKIYVLHAFQKKSKSEIKTPQSDKDLIRKRYNTAVSAAKEGNKNE